MNAPFGTCTVIDTVANILVPAMYAHRYHVGTAWMPISCLY